MSFATTTTTRFQKHLTADPHSDLKYVTWKPGTSPFTYTPSKLSPRERGIYFLPPTAQLPIMLHLQDLIWLYGLAYSHFVSFTFIKRTPMQLLLKHQNSVPGSSGAAAKLDGFNPLEITFYSVLIANCL